jgi:hypothetical protein
MDNQHREISGYRELNEREIAAINDIKRAAEEIELLIESLVARTVNTDARWLAIGKTELQQGFMALVRAVAQPTTF